MSGPSPAIWSSGPMANRQAGSPKDRLCACPFCRIWTPVHDHFTCAASLARGRGMMKYLCLIYNEEKKLSAMSKREREALAGEAAAYGEELRRRGHLIAAEILRCGQTATTVRVRNGRASATEGPVAGAQERL